jgi:hypothetical protein
VFTAILLVLVIIGLLGLAAAKRRRPNAGGDGRAGGPAASAVGDAEAEARRWYDRLGGQVLALTGTDDASRQALADASERYTAAGSQLDQARTAAQFHLVTDTALEGLYYVRAARVAMDMDPGPELPGTSERQRAGALSAERSVQVDGRTVTGSPSPSDRTSHYYPGGTVQGRSVPAGWYSEPWWKPMLLGGVGAIGGVMLADALFSGFGGGFGGWDGGGFGGGGLEAAGFDGGWDGGFGGFDGGFGGGGFDDWGF